MMKTERWAAVFFVFYLLILLRITVFRSGFGTHPLFLDGTVSVSLFAGYVPLVKGGHWFLFFYLFLGNIIWFVPFGLYLAYAGWPGSLRGILLCGFLLSFFIESMQYVFGTGVSDLDDLVLNSLGAWSGALTGMRLRVCRERKAVSEEVRRKRSHAEGRRILMRGGDRPQGCACAGNGTAADDSGGYSEGREAAIRRADAPDWPVRMHNSKAAIFREMRLLCGCGMP